MTPEPSSPNTRGPRDASIFETIDLAGSHLQGSLRIAHSASTAWLNEQLTSTNANLVLLPKRDHASFTINGETVFHSAFKYPLELLRLLREPELCINPRFDRANNTWTAMVEGDLRYTRLRRSYVYISVISSPDSVELVKLTQSNLVGKRFPVREYSDLPAMIKSRSRNPDLVIVADSHPDWRTVENRRTIKGLGLTLKASEVSVAIIIDLDRAAHVMDVCLGFLERSLPTFHPKRSTSLPERFQEVMVGVLEVVQVAPVEARLIMQVIDSHLIPALRRCGFVLAWSLPTADDALISPLLPYHKDEAALVRKTRSLQISPLAGLTYLAADALHMRYFASYDAADIVKIPYLMEVVLPEFERQIELCRSGSTSSDRESDLKSLRRYIRGVANSLVSFVDLGAFDEEFGELINKSPRRPFSLGGETYGIEGITEAGLRAQLKRYGEKIIELMRKAAVICPEEFTVSVPRWFEYFFGYYGSDELLAVNVFNSHLPADKRISLVDVLTGIESPEVRAYYIEHRGANPRKQRERKRSHFSREARAFVMHGREIWRRFVATVLNSDPALGKLPTVTPIRGLSGAASVFAHAANIHLDNRDLKLLLTQASEFLSRLPPPPDRLRELILHIYEGNRIVKKLSNYMQQEFNLNFSSEKGGGNADDFSFVILESIKTFYIYLNHMNRFAVQSDISMFVRVVEEMSRENQGDREE